MASENLYTPGCVRTWSGQYVNVQKPDPANIFPIDIAVHLSREYRFCNATKKYWSVAEHSIRCMELAEAHYPDDVNLPFKLLMHDAHEYLLRDIPSPVKKLLIGYKALADALQAAIHERFGIKIYDADLVKIEFIDRVVLEWEWEYKVIAFKGLPMDEGSAQEMFLHHFKRLCKTPHTIFP